MDRWQWLKDVGTDPVGFVEPYSSSEESDVEDVYETLMKLADEARESGMEEEERSAEVVARLLKRELDNRETIRRSAFAFAKDVAATLTTVELIERIEVLTAMAARLRANEAHFEVMDPTPRIHEAEAFMCEAELDRRGILIVEGNSPGNPS